MTNKVWVVIHQYGNPPIYTLLGVFDDEHKRDACRRKDVVIDGVNRGNEMLVVEMSLNEVKQRDM